MNIALVILNWNGKALLEQFLPSVLKYSSIATIYVADNNSTDDSIEYLLKNHPEVNIIRNKENYGYAKGYNVALQNIDADVYGLINSDIEVTPEWLDGIQKEFTKNKKTAIVQPKILDFKNKEKFEYAGAAGGYLDKYGYSFCKGRIFNSLEKDKTQYKSSTILWASGAAFFIRKETFEDLNGFDEDYFAHYEEIDLCWRAFNKGNGIKAILDSTVYHVGGATLKNSNPFKTYLNFRNSLYTLVKNLPKEKLVPIIFTRMVLDGVAGIRFLILGQPKHLWSVLKSHISFYKNLSTMYKKRTSNQNKKYYHQKSIVWSYFINKQQTFKS